MGTELQHVEYCLLPQEGGGSDLTNGHRASHSLNIRCRATLCSLQFNLNIAGDLWNAHEAEIGKVPQEQVKFGEIWLIMLLIPFFCAVEVIASSIHPSIDAASTETVAVVCRDMVCEVPSHMCV